MALRLLRYLRVSIHVFQGIGTTAFVFPMVELQRRRELIKRWSVKLLGIMNIESRVRGMPPSPWAGNVLVVANHISWLDIFVLNTVEPGRFIAKVELASWPLVGHLIAGCGTLFLDRSSRRDAHRINEQARVVLAAGDTIAIFPEGTTTDGTTLLPFHGSLLQPVVDALGHVQPIAIRYANLDGTFNDRPAYVGDTVTAEAEVQPRIALAGVAFAAVVLAHLAFAYLDPGDRALVPDPGSLTTEIMPPFCFTIP
jgi:1-acyl-sn-glycerol-3-phosphate acyltransferase